jgi:uncharacterized protein YndB with AHSA1/START domain
MTELRYRLHLRAAPETVFRYLATAEGRARFWAEAAPEESHEGDGPVIAFRFPDGSRLSSRVLACEPPHHFAVEYFGGTHVRFELAPDGAGGTELRLEESGLAPADREENAAGWVSVLLALKAAADHGADLRNHDPSRTWREGYVEN